MKQAKKPLFSAIIPTYNRSQLLKEAISSVQTQEGAGELFDLEIIVVDDASTDDTPRLMKQYPEINYIRLEKNRGQSGALNAGIRASRGDYIALLDDDDLWLPNRLKDHLPAFENDPDVGVVYGQIQATGGGPVKLWPDADRAPSGDAFPYSLTDELVLPMHVTIRKGAFDKAGFFDEALRTMNHYDMFLRLSYHVPFAFVPKPVAVGRFSEDAKWFTNVKRGLYVKNTLFIIERMLKEIPDVVKRDSLRRKAYIAWLGHFNYWLAKAGAFDQIESLFMSMIEEEPWLISDPKAHPYVRNSLTRIARRIAQHSDSSISDIRLFLGRVKQKLDRYDQSENCLNFRNMQSSVWMTVAIELTEDASMRHRRMAAVAACYALLNSPLLMRRKSIWRILFRSFLDVPQWSTFVAGLKR